MLLDVRKVYQASHAINSSAEYYWDESIYVPNTALVEEDIVRYLQDEGWSTYPYPFRLRITGDLSLNTSKLGNVFFALRKEILKRDWRAAIPHKCLKLEQLSYCLVGTDEETDVISSKNQSLVVMEFGPLGLVDIR